MKKLHLIICMVLALSACSHYSSSGESLYLRSRHGAMLEVPAPLTKANISNFYNLPPQNQEARIRIKPPK